jgi:two-component system phosphate regulon sensor histidine kinase PhoR
MYIFAILFLFTFVLYQIELRYIMKSSSLVLIFAVALLFLFVLQALWLYHTYKLNVGNIEIALNSIFNEAVGKELDYRSFILDKKLEEHLSDSSIYIASFDIDHDSAENPSVISQQLDLIQHLLVRFDILFSLQAVDSIFQSLLHSSQYAFQFQVSHVDSAGITIATAGQPINCGFKTVELPIINGEKTYAVVKISAPVVFRNMLAMLIVSVLILFFIIACIIYEIRIILDQHHLNQLRENFSHALTHDMKTPLATIHSVLIQLEKKSPNIDRDMRKKFSAIAIEQTINLQKTVNQILTLTCFEKKQIVLNKQAVDLPVMIRSLIDQFSVKSNKNISFQVSYDLKNISVYADLLYLNNAVSNLIDNAIKYSGDSVAIEIECIAGEKHITVSVKDNGFGISAKDQLVIYNRFERGAEIKRNCISGFGIGLNYVRQVIEAHGGTVTVLSQEGVGSEFIITLPLTTIPD